MKKFEISVIIRGNAHNFTAESADKQGAIQQVAKEVYKYFGEKVVVDGYVVREMD